MGSTAKYVPLHLMAEKVYGVNQSQHKSRLPLSVMPGMKAILAKQHNSEHGNSTHGAVAANLQISSLIKSFLPPAIRLRWLSEMNLM